MTITGTGIRRGRRAFGRAIGLAVGLSVAAAAGLAAAQEPVAIKLGHGAAAEEQLWLMKARPDLTPHQGTAYTLELLPFRGTDQRFQAYEAEAIDGGTGSANSVIFAASQGVDFLVVASLSRESSRGFATQYLVRDDAGIDSPADLKGKTVGINGFKSSIHLWARMVLEAAGLDPDRDVTYAPVRFPAQGEALRAGKIDVGAFPQPFALMEQQKGGVKVLFTSKDAVPFEEELILLFLRREFVTEHPAAVRAFLADLRAATDYYLANGREARQALIDAGFVRLDPEVYFAVPDYYRAPDLKVDVEGLKRMQESQIAAGFQDEAADIDAFVDLTYLP